MREASIIGAGPAGSIAALCLARAGWRVNIWEQHRLPRPKVCGECLSALGFDVLRRLGLSELIQSQGAVAIHRAVFVSPDGTSASFDLPESIWGLSREALDLSLVQAARAAGTAVWEQHRCERIEPGERPVCHVRDVANGTASIVSPDVVLLADGKGALGMGRHRATGDFGVKAIFRGIAAAIDAVTVFGLHGHYGGVAPIETERWNVALSVPESMLRRHRGDLQSLFDSVCDRNPTVATLFRHAQRVGDWMAAPLPRFGVVENWPVGVIPIGNATAAIEPIGGEGMGLAMRSAELAAQMLIDADRRGVAPDLPQLRAQFRSLWTMRRHACRAAGWAMSRPIVADALLPMFSLHGPLTRATMALMGKGASFG